MLRLNIFVCAIAQYLINYSFVLCEEDAWKIKSSMSNIEDLIDPHSFSYDRSSKKMLLLNNQRHTQADKTNVPEPSLKSNHVIENCKTQEVFYKRLVMMLLSNAVLEENEDTVEGTIHIRGTVDQIKTLRKFGNGDYTFNEIDALLSELLQKPTRTYTQYLSRSYNDLLSILKIIEENKQAIIIIITSLCTLMIVRKLSMSCRLFIYCILCVVFTTSFFMTWWRLIKEAEIKLAATQMQYLEMPAACRPHNMNMWDKMKSFFFAVDTKECEKYYEARMSDPKFQVTPAIVLSHMLSNTLLHPISHLGHAVSSFIDNSTGHLYWLKGPVQVILYLSLPAFFVVILFYFKGGSVNLGLGPLFKFSFNTHMHTQSDNDVKMLRDAQKREAIELIREVVTDALSAPVSDNKNEPNNDTKETLMLKLTQEDSASSGSGDTAANNMYLEKTSEAQEKSEKSIEINKEKDVGGGDG